MVYTYDEQEQLFSGHSGHIFVLITTLWFCVSLTSRLLPPLLPEIIDALAITSFLAGAALTAERVARAAVEFPSGRLADQLSRTTVLIACVGFAIVGITILSIAYSYLLFVIGVVVFGIGRGMYSPASRGLLSDIFREKRGRAFGFHMMGSEIAGVAGSGIAIVIVAYATWRAAFAPLAIVLLPLLAWFYFLSREPISIKPISFQVRQTGSRVLGTSSFRWILAVYSLYVIAASGVSSFLPLFLIEVHAVSYSVATSAFALLYVAGIIAKPVSGYLSDRLPRLYIASGALGTASGGLALLVVAPAAWMAIGGVFVYALGYRGVPPGLQAYLMDEFPDENMSGDLGAMRTIYLSIGSLGPAYAGFTANTIGFVNGFTSLLMCYLLGGGILLWVSMVRN